MTDRPGETIKDIATRIVANCDPELVGHYLQAWEREARAAARSLAWYGRRAKALRAAIIEGAKTVAR